jgi:hypothetical protein
MFSIYRTLYNAGEGGPYPPEVMGRVLGIVYRCIATHLVKKTGFSRRTAQTSAVTLNQRLSSALNLNVHFHVLFWTGCTSSIATARCASAERRSANRRGRSAEST